MNTFLISLKRLRDFYLIDHNLDDKYIISNIQKSQDFVVKPLIGEDKYNELISQIDSGTISSLNITLLDKIEPVIAYYVMGEVLFSTYKLKNAMVDDPNGTRYNEITQLAKKYRNDSEHYATILEEWVCDNSIVLYESKKSENIFNKGIYLGKGSDYRYSDRLKK